MLCNVEALLRTSTQAYAQPLCVIRRSISVRYARIKSLIIRPVRIFFARFIGFFALRTFGVGDAIATKVVRRLVPHAFAECLHLVLATDRTLVCPAVIARGRPVKTLVVLFIAPFARSLYSPAASAKPITQSNNTATTDKPFFSYLPSIRNSNFSM